MYLARLQKVPYEGARITVRADIITELILHGKGRSSNYWDFLRGSNSFQTDSSNFVLQECKAWKLLETIVNSRQGLSRNKISNFSEINSGNMFPDRYHFGLDSTQNDSCQKAMCNRLSGTGDSQRDSICANHSQLQPQFS